MVRIMTDCLRDESGATAIEYAMIASAVSIVIAAVLITIGTSVSGMFTDALAGLT